MLLAWRRPDGRYAIFQADGDWSGMILRTGFNPALHEVSVAEAAIPPEARRVYGVVTGPSSCHCEPAGFRWVTESEVRAGRTQAELCHACCERYEVIFGYERTIFFDREIIDVCGEADVAESVYEQEFARSLS